jgi:hypothetical protein
MGPAALPPVIVTFHGVGAPDNSIPPSEVVYLLTVSMFRRVIERMHHFADKVII